MISDNHMELFMKKVMDQLGIKEADGNKDNKRNPNENKNNNDKCKKPRLSTSQILVITALLADALEVNSFSVDRNQEIQIILTGSLKRKTQMEKIMDQVGQKPFDEVMKTLMGRY